APPPACVWSIGLDPAAIKSLFEQLIAQPCRIGPRTRRKQDQTVPHTLLAEVDGLNFPLAIAQQLAIVLAQFAQRPQRSRRLPVGEDAGNKELLGGGARSGGRNVGAARVGGEGCRAGERRWRRHARRRKTR